MTDYIDLSDKIIDAEQDATIKTALEAFKTANEADTEAYFLGVIQEQQRLKANALTAAQSARATDYLDLCTKAIAATAGPVNAAVTTWYNNLTTKPNTEATLLQVQNEIRTQERLYAVGAAVVPTTTTAYPVQTFFTSTTTGGRSPEKRLSEGAQMYDRAARAAFSFEDAQRARHGISNVPKHIPRIKQVDLDALARSSDVSSRSKALQHVTSTMESLRRLEEHLSVYGSNEAFHVLVGVNPSDVTKASKVVNLFTDWAQVTPGQVIEFTDYISNNAPDNVFKTWEQDLVWTKTTVFNIIDDPNLAATVRIALEIYPEHNRTGPLTLLLATTETLRCTPSTRASIKRTWLYDLQIVDFPAGNVTRFINDWKAIKNFLHSFGEDVSDSPRQFIEALLQCPNQDFKNHFKTLQSVSDPRLASEQNAMAEAQLHYSTLISKGKWNVRSREEQNAFQNRRRNSPKANHAAQGGGKPPSPPPPSPPADPKGLATSHDKQGHPIDRAAPKQGEPHTRKNKNTGRDEKWCADSHCKRWGNHSTDGHADWYKKFKDNQQKRNKQKKDKANSASQSNQENQANPLRIPTGTEDFTGQS